MFDEGWDPETAAYYDRQAALADLIDERDVVGVLPEGPFLPDGAPPAGTDAEVCAAAADERVSLCSGLLAAFDGVDVAALGASAAVDAAVAADRAGNRFTAVRLEAIAATVRLSRRATRVEPERAAAAELGPVLRLGTRSIDREIGYALELTGRLRRTWTAMHAGDLGYGKARLLVDETFDLCDDEALAVESAVLDKAAERTWTQHAAAVRRAVVRVDPRAPERRRKAAERAAGLVRSYGNDGLAALIVKLPAAQVDAAYTAADAWARARKAAGDDRKLDVLRAEAIARWASSYLTHGDSTTCDRVCDPVASPVDCPGPECEPERVAGDDLAGPDAGDAARPPAVDPDTGEIIDLPPKRRVPTRHGRPLRVGLIWDLAGLLGLDDSPGELLDSGEVISAADMRALVAGGMRLRRMLVDPETGELVDLTPGTWLLPPDPAAAATTDALPHGRPMWLGVVVDTTTWQEWRERRLPGLLATAITLAPRPIRDLMDAPRTDNALDERPEAEHPSAALAEFVALRDRHPTNPTAAPTAAGAGDLDHVVPRSAGGPTTRQNLHTPTRRWHVLRTHGGWQLRPHPQGGWIWTSPQGRPYRTRPHDYRRGP